MNWQATFDRLDTLSRKRALTDAESRMLEHALKNVKRPASQGRGRPGAWTDSQEARFFDLIADGVAIRQAAVAVGKPENSGISRFRRARRDLGWQAA